MDPDGIALIGIALVDESDSLPESLAPAFDDPEAMKPE